ncbi:MAG: hypothetical protein ACYTBP_13890 [Planctomycetota bacterium]
MTIINHLFTSTYKPHYRTVDPKVEGSSPFGLVSQSADDTALTKARSKHDSSKNQNLVSGLFFDSQFEADLKLIIERWPKLSVELRRVIVKMVK